VTAQWPRAAVFDLDGLLVDTQDCWRRAVGATGDDGPPAGASVADVARTFGVPPSAIKARLLEEIRRLDPKPLPGAVALLERLVARLPLAIASNSPREAVMDLLDRVQVRSAFKAIVSVDDVSRGKPAPDVYLHACELMGVDPSETIAFEDSSIGARAARAAGAVVVGVPRGADELAEADLVVSRLDDSALLEFIDIVGRTAAHVRSVMEGEGTGHDWWHVQRVWSTASLICNSERADRLVVELGALLHDLADWKFNGGDLTAGPRAARSWLDRAGAPERLAERVSELVGQVSFKSADTPDSTTSIEARIVQDADRLDALGAIGIARAFAYGGFAGNVLHDPDPTRTGTTVAHFHEKLLLLRDRMHTDTGRRLAAERHAYLEQFLERFLREWDGRA
jgi:uncharacterized protein